MGRPRAVRLSSLSPRQVPFALAGQHPELQLLTAKQATIVHGLVEGAAGLGALVQSIQQQGPPGTDSGWARTEKIILSDGKPAKNSLGKTIYRLRISDDTLTAAVPVLTEVLTATMSDDALRGFCWTVQDGVVPGPESGGAAAPRWSVTSLGPWYGVQLARVDFDAAVGQLQLTCVNEVARHLGVYCEFRAGGKPVEPSGWKSRLPASVPAALETRTLKFLGVLAPNTPVAGLPLPTGPQVIALPMPAVADSVDLSFGSFGNGEWEAVPDAGGVMLTFLIDYALPSILASAGGSIDDGFYQRLLADPQVQAQVMAAAAPLVTDTSIGDTAALLARLSTAVAASLLDVGLAELRDRIDDHLGADSVADAAPLLGWAAQTTGAMFAASSPTFSRLASLPGSFSLRLWPGFAVTIAATVEPDAATGAWPDRATRYELGTRYAGGFEQRQGGALAQQPPAGPVHAAFPSVRTDAPIELSAVLYDAAGEPAAEGSLVIDHPRPAAGGQLGVMIPIVDRRVVISAATRYTLRRTLSFDSRAGTYAWGPGVPSTATKHALACEPGKGQLCELVGITLQQATRSLGYTWRTSDNGVPECGGGGPTTVSYRFQNIGLVDPEQPHKTIDCGFAAQPQLVYAATPSLAAVFLDPRVQPPSLRPVSLQAPGSFDLATKLSRGRLLEPDVSAIAIHGDGYAIAVSSVNASAQIVGLTLTAVADTDAPLSRLVAGRGEREGLLGSPVAVSVAAGGEILVLDAAPARVLAFDVRGNPLAIFGGVPYFDLKQEPGIEYQDLAASPSGLFYVLSNARGGQQPADYRLDVYSADGSFLARTTGVTAARIEVDSAERIYTLEYRAIAGPGGRTEPSIGQWSPTG